MSQNLDIDKLSSEISEELTKLYEKEFRQVTSEEVEANGKISGRTLTTIEIIALKRHCERFATELIKRVFETSK